MTKETRSYILDFSKSGDLRMLPSIFIGMQEEDNIGEVISFKNCIKLIRNISAHTPNVLISQIKNAENEGNSKIVLKPRDDQGGIEKRVVIDIVHFTAWLFDAKLKTGDVAYLVFWKAFMNVLYPNMSKQRVCNGRTFKLYEAAHNGKAIHMFSDYQNFMWDNFGEVKTIGLDDPYTIKVFLENPKLFWKLAIPNMMEIVRLFVCDVISVTDENNLNGYIHLVRSREGI